MKVKKNNNVKSIEPEVANLANSWLMKINQKVYLEQADTSDESINMALKDYESKNGGKGGNRPDAKLLLRDKYGNMWPVLIEYKGTKGCLANLLLGVNWK